MIVQLLLLALACMVASARELPRVSRRTRAVAKSYEPDPSEVFPLGFDNKTPPLENLPTVDIRPSAVHSRPRISRSRGTKIRSARQTASFYLPEANAAHFQKSVYKIRKPGSPSKQLNKNVRDNYGNGTLIRELGDTVSSLLHAGEEEQIPDEPLGSVLHDHKEYDDGLVHPNIKLCLNRYQGFGSHATYGESSYVISRNHPHYYLVSPETGEPIDVGFTWLDARNECRKRCMELVSINTSGENFIVKLLMNENDVDAVWTAGRLCDGTFCNATTDMEPLRENGWVWSNNNVKLSTKAIPKGFNIQPWSLTGARGERQPDNNSGFYVQEDENCIAMLVDVFADDGTKWSDVRCDHLMHFICEDSEELLEDVQRDIALRED